MLDTILASMDIRSCAAVRNTSGKYSLVFTKKDGSTFSVELPAVSVSGGSSDSGGSGVTPTITAEETETGVIITITDALGSTSAEIRNGVDGAPGEDGYSPTAKVEQTSNGALITITDKNGTTTALVTNGTNGSGSGSGGTGADGFSPIANVTQTETGAIISITDAAGTTTATITNGGDGTPGKDGADGVGIASVVRTSGDGAAGSTDTYTITFTNDATTTFTVYNGRDGVDGSNGNDGTDASVVVDSTVTDGGTNAVNSAAVIAYVDSVLGDFEAVAAQMDALIGG
ncbi:MAG: hypothetical protein J6S14_17195 [Clostridia bacterium]|nr:hypothetical protein [Clostridia bacterium]